jgi:hypothetical protein
MALVSSNLEIPWPDGRVVCGSVAVFPCGGGLQILKSTLILLLQGLYIVNIVGALTLENF